jgi:hypothetical protein
MEANSSSEEEKEEEIGKIYSINVFALKAINIYFSHQNTLNESNKTLSFSFGMGNGKYKHKVVPHFCSCCSI